MDSLFTAHSAAAIATVSAAEPLYVKLDIRGAFDNIRHASVAAFLTTLPAGAAYGARRLTLRLPNQTITFFLLHEDWEIHSTNGAPQGGSDSAGLFASTLGYALGKFISGWEREGHAPLFPAVWLLLYVDDILLMFKNWGQATFFLSNAD
eukprot:Skav215369  [mRNA]  locus=scaffold1391:818339:818788:- [translate_table: standard]